MTEIVHYSRRILLLRRRHDGRPSVTRDSMYYLHNNVSMCNMCFVTALMLDFPGCTNTYRKVAFTLLLLKVVSNKTKWLTILNSIECEVPPAAVCAFFSRILRVNVYKE